MDEITALALSLTFTPQTLQLRNLGMPVNSLPPELHSSIFELLISRRGCLDDLTTATRVCSLWRSIALATPSLWTVISSIEDVSPFLFELYLQRSQNATIHVELVLRAYDLDLLSQYVPPLIPHLYRVKTLYLVPISPCNVLDSLLLCPAPQLAAFALICNSTFSTDSPDVRWCLPDHLFSDCAPHLRRVYLLPPDIPDEQSDVLRHVTNYSVFSPRLYPRYHETYDKSTLEWILSSFPDLRTLDLTPLQVDEAEEPVQHELDKLTLGYNFYVEQTDFIPTLAVLDSEIIPCITLRYPDVASTCSVLMEASDDATLSYIRDDNGEVCMKAFNYERWRFCVGLSYDALTAVLSETTIFSYLTVLNFSFWIPEHDLPFPACPLLEKLSLCVDPPPGIIPASQRGDSFFRIAQRMQLRWDCPRLVQFALFSDDATREEGESWPTLSPLISTAEIATFIRDHVRRDTNEPLRIVFFDLDIDEEINGSLAPLVQQASVERVYPVRSVGTYSPDFVTKELPGTGSGDGADVDE